MLRTSRADSLRNSLETQDVTAATPSPTPSSPLLCTLEQVQWSRDNYSDAGPQGKEGGGGEWDEWNEGSLFLMSLGKQEHPVCSNFKPGVAARSLRSECVYKLPKLLIHDELRTGLKIRPSLLASRFPGTTASRGSRFVRPDSLAVERHSLRLME